MEPDGFMKDVLLCCCLWQQRTVDLQLSYRLLFLYFYINCKTTTDVLTSLYLTALHMFQI